MFEFRPSIKIQFKCIVPGCIRPIIERKVRKSSNLKKHLESHERLRNWLKSYVDSINRISSADINSNMLLLIKYFLSSNTAVKELENPFLRKLLKFNLPTPYTFNRKILPQVKYTLKQSLIEQLKRSKSICLIIDLWSNNSNQQFLAVAASIIFNNFHKSIRIIGMIPTNGESNSEKIKECVEMIVNIYEFDKTKIVGVNCDQGSLVRLFKQIENFLFDREIENDQEEEVRSIANTQSDNTAALSSQESLQSTQQSTQSDERQPPNQPINNELSINIDQIDKEIHDIVDGYDDEDYLDEDYEIE